MSFATSNVPSDAPTTTMTTAMSVARRPATTATAVGAALQTSPAARCGQRERIPRWEFKFRMLSLVRARARRLVDTRHIITARRCEGRRASACVRGRTPKFRTEGEYNTHTHTEGLPTTARGRKSCRGSHTRRRKDGGGLCRATSGTPASSLILSPRWARARPRTRSMRVQMSATPRGNWFIDVRPSARGNSL